MLLSQIKRLGRRSQQWWHGLTGPLPQPEKWVFLVGCYNSGTTLLAKLLSSHPQIGSMPREGQFYTDQFTTPYLVGLPRLWALKPDLFRMDETFQGKVNVTRLKKQWGANMNHPERPVLLEKSPTNAARVRWLQSNFENSYFIGIIRDGYAVSEGIHRKAGHKLEMTAQQWSESNRIMLSDFDHLENAKIVRYEALTAEPEECLHNILAFLDLPPLIERIEGKSWRIHEQETAIRNMNEKSFKRLSPEQLTRINAVAGRMLMGLDYYQH